MVDMIIVDSNIFIFAESADSPERLQALNKYKSAAQSGQIGINIIIVSEVFHKLQLFLNRAEACARLTSILSSPEITFLDVSHTTATRAVKLARDFGMTINDAIIAQQALDENAAVLTDDVKDFKKLGSVKVIPLRTG